MKRIATLLLGSVVAASCASPSSPTQPTPRTVASVPGARTSLTVDAPAATSSGPRVAPADLGRCLAASNSPACFTATLLRSQGAVAGAVAPGAPSTLTATSSGSSVTLTWSAPATGDPVQSYTIEAGSTSGAANLANFSTGSTATTFSTAGVPNGAYFVRVRASNSAGLSAPSNEAVLVVGSLGCTAAPGSPGNLFGTATTSGTVVLTWTAASGTPTSYVIEAGSASGLANLANSDLGGVALSFTANNVGSGTYYVRVRAKNACGLGSPSNEFRLVVPAPDSNGIWRGLTPQGASVRFDISSNQVMFFSLSTSTCSASFRVFFGAGLSITNGAFSYSSTSITFNGTILSTSGAQGTVQGCGLSTTWTATKQ